MISRSRRGICPYSEARRSAAPVYRYAGQQNSRAKTPASDVTGSWVNAVRFLTGLDDAGVLRELLPGATRCERNSSWNCADSGTIRERFIPCEGTHTKALVVSVRYEMKPQTPLRSSCEAAAIATRMDSRPLIQPPLSSRYRARSASNCSWTSTRSLLRCSICARVFLIWA